MPKDLNYGQLVDKLEHKLAPSLAQDWPELPVVRAEGAMLYTIDGREILDFTSGVGVTNVGHNHPKVLSAVIDQLKTFSHSAVGITLSEPLLRYTEKLTEVMPDGMEMFFFGNSGSEAVEGALKLARYVTRRPGYIAFRGSFHGRTYGAISVTSVKSKYRNNYDPFLPGIYFAEYAYPYRCPAGSSDEAVTNWALESVERLFTNLIPADKVAGIIVEPVLGEGGYVPPSKGFLEGLREICDKNGILLIFDEVQTGFGRTGEMFAAQSLGVNPDVMAIAKGIANGFPMGATVSSEKIMSQWSAGSHGTTFGGNPVAAAAGLAVQEVIQEENLLENARSMGALFKEKLNDLASQYDCIGEVRGIGLMVAIEFVKPDGKTPDSDKAMQLLNNMLENGLLAYMAGRWGQVVRFIPPLIVSEEEIGRAIGIFEAGLKKMM